MVSWNVMTPIQRVSFEVDSDHSLPTMQWHSVLSAAFAHLTRGSDPRQTSTSPASGPSVEEHRDVNSSFNVQDLILNFHLSGNVSSNSGLLVSVGHRTPLAVEEPFRSTKLHYDFPFCCFPPLLTYMFWRQEKAP